MNGEARSRPASVPRKAAIKIGNLPWAALR